MTRSLIAFAAFAAAHAGDVMNEGHEERVDEAYRALFSTEYGRMVLIDLFNRHTLTAPSFTPGMAVNDALFLEGMKQVVSEILTRALAGDALNQHLSQSEGAQNDGRTSTTILD